MSIASIKPVPVGGRSSRPQQRAVHRPESVSVASDLFADLVISAAQVSAFDVAEAQCEEKDVDLALQQALGRPLARILKGENAMIWAGLYLRTFVAALHRRQFLTALPIISVQDLLTFMTAEMEAGHGLAAGEWQELRDSLFGRPRDLR
ncbi:hypothetical protein V3C33_20990 (plasmid) [Micrococcaceae bacterium Sec5.7]